MVNAMCGTLAALDFDNLNKETIAAGVIGLLLNTQRRPQAQQQAASGTRTEFTEMTGSARLTNGVARNDDLVMVSPVVRVRGAGTVDLPQDRIEYRAEAELVQSCAGIGKRDLSGHVIPVTIVGPIADPSVKPEIPVGLIQALRRRRASEPAPAAATAPVPTAPAPGAGWGAPAPSQPPAEQQAQPEPQQPTKRGHVIKDARDEAIKGILKGLFK